MIDSDKRSQKEQEKERTRRRMHAQVDRENYEYIPEKKRVDYYDNDTPMRVAIYVRVSTDDVRQTTSYELQKRYYEDFVKHHPHWTLVRIYADEGISGTMLENRAECMRMLADCRAGKVDLVITKSVSRLARNILVSIGIVRELAELKHPVGVFFESECIFSLNDDSAMALSFVATMAEEESHTRSRSMETSLRMRLDNGIPLTPKLLGFKHDADGGLIINPEEAPTVKLVFYMYLFGYSTQQIADALIALGRKSYLGNIKWTAGSIVQILRNERHCGDVLTRKTFTPNFRTHKSVKNRGDRPQSHYYNHHDPIVSRDDFIAVQRMLDNARFKNKSYLPELRVLDSGIFKGFVVINPRWAAFGEQDYYQAAQSICATAEEATQENGRTEEIRVEVEAGDFDMRGFEVARAELFDTQQKPYVLFSYKKIKFSKTLVGKLGDRNTVEFLINPVDRLFAIRIAEKGSRHGVVCSKPEGGEYIPKDISTAAFSETLFSIFGWNADYKYRITGSLYEHGTEIAYIFDTRNTEAFFKSYVLPGHAEGKEGQTPSVQPFMPSGKHIRGIPEEWTSTFGKQYYLYEKSVAELESQSEDEWKLRIEGQLYETGKKLNVTGYEELRLYIKKELSGISPEEVN